MFWVVFEVTVGSSNFPRRFHPKVSKGLSGFNDCRSQVVVSSLCRFNAIIGDVPLCILQQGRLVVASLNAFTKVENNGINLICDVMQMQAILKQSPHAQ